jgi:hypothetical protein
MIGFHDDSGTPALAFKSFFRGSPFLSEIAGSAAQSLRIDRKSRGIQARRCAPADEFGVREG